MISVRNLSKAFGTVKAVRHVSFTASAGQTVALIGPSGCGKTTLLRIMAGLDRPDEGQVLYGGIDKQLRCFEKGNGDEKWRVGMVFQALNLWPHLTVMENVSLAPIIAHRSERNDIKEKALGWLKRMGIAEKAAARPSELSGGQQQKAALARALIMETDVLLLDEITSALDPESIAEIHDIIAETARGNRVVVLATHHVHFASRVADNILFMMAGTIIEKIDGKDLLKNPRTARLKSFLDTIERSH